MIERVAGPEQAKTPSPFAAGEPLLTVEGLSIRTAGAGSRTITTGTDLVVWPGETVGIVGESGSGKSLTARAIIGLLPSGLEVSGRVRYRGSDLLNAPESVLRSVRGSGISMLFQDPFTMLNPLLRCGRHIEEGVSGNGRRRSRSERRGDVTRRLAEVGIRTPDVASRYPFQLSGGMRQRVALAAALARDPELLIADEPSTALDVTTQAEILELLRSVQRARSMGMILITHDLRVAFSTCDRIYVLYAGSLIEVGPAPTLEREPLHPYTLGLLLSEPPADRRLRELIAIEGTVPPADDVAGMCSFAPRCAWKRDECVQGDPPLVEVEHGRRTACVRIQEIRAEMGALRDRSLGHSTAAAASGREPESLVRVEAVRKTFRTGGGSLVEALKGVTLEIRPGESVGLVGESGSGKTTLGRCLVGLETPDQGRVEIDGVDASDFGALRPVDRAHVRRTIQMIFQDPYSTLNPRHSIERSLREALRMARDDGASRGASVEELLRRVGLPWAFAARKPHALSGGERQRVAIARSLAVNPRILVCDEPVSALDVSVQAQILNLFTTLQKEFGLAYLFITHDLAVVRQVADRIYVLYEGEVVEEGPADDVLSRPEHWYTRKLMESIPSTSA